MDDLEVGGEVPLRSEPGRAVEAEVNILVLLAAVQRQVPATDEQCCGTGTGTVGTVTFCLAEPEPEPCQKVGTGTVINYSSGILYFDLLFFIHILQ